MKEIHINIRIDVYKREDEVPAAWKTLLREARQSMEMAYAPYSRFKVGSAALLANGEIIKGCNQENASFPAGLCSERVCLFTAGSMYPESPVDILAIYTSLLEDYPLTPCGECRQVMIEFENRYQREMQVLLTDKYQRIYHIKRVSDLLPLSFRADFLRKSE